MEKRKPHCPLPIVQSMVRAGKVHATNSATRSAYRLGFELREMVDIIRDLKLDDFYKSMTTYSDNRVWQDVYHPKTKVGKVYLKLMVVSDVVIVSFKEL